MTQQELMEVQETLSIMETPKLTKRFATYFVAVLVGAYMFGRIVGGENAAFYFCMAAPVVWIVSAFVYQSKLKAGNNREAYDDMEAEMHTAKNQLTQAVVLIRKLQSEAAALQSASAELQSTKNKLQLLEENFRTVSNRSVALLQSAKQEKQLRLKEKAIAEESLASAKSIADIALKDAIKKEQKRYAPFLELAEMTALYKVSESKLLADNTAKQLGEEELKQLRSDREKGKLFINAFVKEYNAKTATA